MDEERQIAELRKMVRRHLPEIMQWVCLIGGLGLVGWGAFVAREGGPYFACGAFTLFLAYIFRDGTPHIKAAARALDDGVSQREWVVIEIDRSSDRDSYYLESAAPDGKRWRFEFIWQGRGAPSEGRQEATVYRMPDLPWPALVRLPGAVVWPRQKPEETDRSFW